MTADESDRRSMGKHSGFASRFRSFRCRLMVVVVATILLALLTWCWLSSNWSTLMTDRTTGPRYTMSRFAGAHHLLALFRTLPFPVRHAPATDLLAKVNGEGEALYSWRAEVSGFAAAWESDWNYHEPWDSDVNRALMWRDFLFAADDTPPPTWDSKADQKVFPQTIMVAIVGPGTAFGDNKTRTPLEGLPGSAILLVESRASGIPWPAPGDFDIRTMPRTINAEDGKGISGQNPGGFVVLFADGEVWFLSEETPFETLEKFFTIEGAKTHDRESLLGPFALDRCRGPLCSGPSSGERWGQSLNSD